jgi:hypothetical protein
LLAGEPGVVQIIVAVVVEAAAVLADICQVILQSLYLLVLLSQLELVVAPGILPAPMVAIAY